MLLFGDGGNWGKNEHFPKLESHIWLKIPLNEIKFRDSVYYYLLKIIDDRKSILNSEKGNLSLNLK